jgi:EAL domain-containing protein (putative c-di-GMP-specific phosphodiesterase class I)
MNADIAMYEAKRQGGNSCAFFTLEAANKVQERLAIETDLRRALSNQDLSVHYQPKVSLNNGRVVGAEALVRWTHPERGDISPSRFIPVAEEAGLIPELGFFVLDQAMQDLSVLLARGFNLTVAVNVSVLQLEDPSFAQKVELRLAQKGFPPSCLELEITESVAMRDSKIINDQISRLRAKGVRFSIDDFGTGYSNLATLARSPLDTLKLDRSLVHGVAHAPEQQAVVRTILSLAKALGFETVVEGISEEADLQFLTAEGADIAQGYFFSPAVTIETFEAFLAPTRLAQAQRDIPIDLDAYRAARGRPRRSGS